MLFETRFSVKICAQTQLHAVRCPPTDLPRRPLLSWPQLRQQHSAHLRLPLQRQADGSSLPQHTNPCLRLQVEVSAGAIKVEPDEDKSFGHVQRRHFNDLSHAQLQCPAAELRVAPIMEIFSRHVSPAADFNYLSHAQLSFWTSELLL